MFKWNHSTNPIKTNKPIAMRSNLMLGMFSIFLFSCNGQPSTAKINFINRSVSKIDSIKINPNTVIKESIDAGETKQIEVKLPVPYPSEESLLNLYLYKGKSIFEANWGLCDFGRCAANVDSIFIFDNGISYKDTPIQKPKEFFVYFKNKTAQKIDSIYSEYAAISKVDSVSNYLRIDFDYNAFSKYPILIIQAGKKIEAHIDWMDWSNWNKNNVFVYLYDDGVSAIKN